MKKPISVQFKFFEDLKALNAPTEPRMPIVQTMQIPAQDQRRLKRYLKRNRVPIPVSLYVLVVALALCGSLLLFIVLHH
jgi:hypothetical protein